MRLSMAAVAAGLVASSVAHPHQAVENEHKDHGIHAPKVLEGVIDERVVVVPTEEDTITPQNHKYHGDKQRESGSSGPIVIKNADGTLSIVQGTESENHHHQDNGINRGSGPVIKFDESNDVILSSGSKASSDLEGKPKAGIQPEKPIYVDIGTSLQNEPPLFPDNVYLSRREIQVFEDLTKGVVQGQKALMECVPSMVPVCSRSLEMWEKLASLVPNYKVVRQVQYIEACTAFRTALEHLSTVEKKHNPKLDAILWKLLLDNLLLAGYLDDVYDGTIIPNYTLDPPGEVIGALIHFIGIDVTKALNFWPVFTPYIYRQQQ